MSKYKPRRTHEADNDPNTSLFSRIVDIVDDQKVELKPLE
jgi:hypothetical protein